MLRSTWRSSILRHQTSAVNAIDENKSFRSGNKIVANNNSFNYSCLSHSAASSDEEIENVSEFIILLRHV